MGFVRNHHDEKLPVGDSRAAILCGVLLMLLPVEAETLDDASRT